jgi:DNA mismatch repair protein MutS
VDAELDEARQLATDSTTWLAQYQARLVAEHQLPSLKVGYNKIFGYYIELPKAQAARAPAEFSRRQTLTGAERYITPELKEFEDKVTTARSRALAREQALFDGLIALAAGALDPITRFADAASQVDVLLALADKAHTRRWVKPEMTLEPVLRIEQGRHPVLDELLEGTFVPNDVALGGDQATLALITGPNMAGKSTFIRQVALITLLAHAGGFVPADKAHIGLTDRIFTRIGADDALHAGQSTFMVEMVETAGILHHAGPRSLVVLDEIGRGTSTLDGLSLAWAIAENLAGAAEPAKPAAKKARPPAATGPGPRTLFATHYHELTRLQEQFPGRVTNLQVAVREWGEQIVFLHRIIAGRADRSYGLHVAKLAGLPAGVVARAREVLDSLSVEHAADARAERAASSRRPADDSQMGLFTQYLSHPAVDRLREMKIESLTPLQAFDELRALKDEAGRTDDQAR